MRPSARLSLTRLLVGSATAGALALAAPLSGMASTQAALTNADVPDLTLVVLNGPGMTTSETGESDRASLVASQDALLGSIDGAQVTYRWTTALNGFAALLTDEQQNTLRGDARVAVVEANQVLPLASLPRSNLGIAAARHTIRPRRVSGGAGVVIGIVDSGIAQDAPVFAAAPGLGRYPQGFSGDCQEGEEWSEQSCNRKVVGARWYVDGFGADRIRTSESLSARDTLGHGTQVASVAAGNSRVSIRLNGSDAGDFGGVAPQARISAYKACWAAPDPADDGCSSADVLTAIDQAVGDGVDVLALAVAGGSGIDAVQHALLGAAEADVVVVGAAGNTRRDSYSAHESPWVTTVGSTLEGLALGSARIAGGPTLGGGGRLDDVAARAVLAEDARALGSSRRHASQCRPGTLDPRKAVDRVVVCDRGGIARIAKSDAVAQADGAAMVLVNVKRGAISADLHAVPTLHLNRADGVTLKKWIRHHRVTRLRLREERVPANARRTAPWTAAGDPRGSALKPDLVAAAGSILSATPDSTGHSWGVFSGSSAATAQVAGTAALLRSRHDWSAAVIRSALASATRPVRARSVFERGAGTLSIDSALGARLGFDVSPGAWRRALDSGRWSALNTPSIMFSPGRTSVTRTVTNLGARAEYFSVTSRGFARHRVTVRPLAVRLAPNESATFTVSVDRMRPGLGLDDGELVWLGARGSRTRMPIAITR